MSPSVLIGYPASKANRQTMLWALLLLAIGALCQEQNGCYRDVPSALAFQEPLVSSVKPYEIVVYSGCHSARDRQSGWRATTGMALAKLAVHHGYIIRFLDEVQIEFDYSFAPQWLRVFALPALRKSFPSAKYFVWFDDDIIAPYHETDMLNHYINIMEGNGEARMLFVREPPPVMLNSGFIIMKNTEFVFDVCEKVKSIAREPGVIWATRHGYEQDAVIEYIKRNPQLSSKFLLLPNRQGIHSINTYIPNTTTNFPGATNKPGDPFVHVLGAPPDRRARDIQNLVKAAEAWRASLPPGCTYPVDLSKAANQTIIT